MPYCYNFTSIEIHIHIKAIATIASESVSILMNNVVFVQNAANLFWHPTKCKALEILLDFII